MKIDNAQAEAILRAAANGDPSPDPQWVWRVERLSDLCEASGIRSHIAFLGTAILAKAVDSRADLVWIKPRHAKENPNAFSARILSEKVLVPVAVDLGISLGVSGRQPLNNQPYFRMTHLDDGTPIHSNGREAFAYMRELIAELTAMGSEDLARAALAAFVVVRQRYRPTYADYSAAEEMEPKHLAAAIARFVSDQSENGKRAQAVVAGLLDVNVGADRVASGRINDPSRHFPGDVCISAADDADHWEKAFEVRDKPVSIADIQIFGRKCLESGLRSATVVMVAAAQQPLDRLRLDEWSLSHSISITLFEGWSGLVEQALFWSAFAPRSAAALAAAAINERLQEIEVSAEGAALWSELVRQSGAER